MISKAESISKKMKKALKKEKLTVKIEKLKNKKVSSVLTVSEDARRMQDMMQMYAASGMDMGMFGNEGETLVLNANHPLVKYLAENKDSENVPVICEQLYDLAMLSHKQLSPDEMTKFVQRSNDVLMMLTK